MYLKNSKKIVVKIGSSLLVDQDKKIRKKWLSSFAKDIKKLRSNNHLFLIFFFSSISNEDPIFITIFFEFLRYII